MRRPYTAEGYLGLLERVRAAIPGVAVTTDVIVGFPGETAAEFEESLATVEAAGFAKVHVFPFSPRPGTEAAGLPGHVAPGGEEGADGADARRRRPRRARPSGAPTSGPGRPCSGRSPRDGMGQGLTDNYLRVLSPDGAGLWNRFSEVELMGLAEDGIRGEIVA